MSFLRQTSFAAGELAPLLHGRTDLPLFGHGARLLRNFFVSKQGAAVSRPGTRYIAKTKLGKARLVPFIYSDSSAFVLEVGNYYARVYAGGVQVQSGGSPLEFATPWTWDQLEALQWAQVGATLTVVHPDVPPYEIRRTSAGAWTCTAIDFNRLSPWWLEVGTLNKRMAPYLVDPGRTSSADGALFTADSTHPLRQWEWWVTATVQEAATGRVMETAPYQVTTCYDGSDYTNTTGNMPTRTGWQVVLSADKPVTLRWGDDASAPALPGNATLYRVLRYNVFRGRGGLYGYVGSTMKADFIDEGAEPDYAVPMPRAENPFAVQAPDGSIAYSYPAAVGFFEGRRIFGGSALLPGVVLASATDDFLNYDKQVIPPADGPIIAELASQRAERVRTLAGLNRLVTLTDGQAWSIGGGQGPWTPDDMLARVEDSVGVVAGVGALILDGALLYARTKGAGVRALEYGPDGGSVFRGRDVSWHAAHLFLGQAEGRVGRGVRTRQVMEWAYAEDPWGLVWAVREDGILLSCQYARETGAAAWTWHETDGDFRSVCAVPESAEDGVYVIVERDIGWCVERLESRIEYGDVEDAGQLDCAVRVSFAASGASGTATVSGLGHLVRKEVYVTGLGAVPQGPVVVSAAGTATFAVPFVANDGANFTGFVGLLFTPAGRTLGVAQGDMRVKQKTVVSVGLEVSDARGLWVGQDDSHLVEWKQRLVSEGYGPTAATAQVVRIPVRGTWDAEAGCYFEQRLPLPVTVVGVTREVDVGG